MFKLVAFFVLLAHCACVQFMFEYGPNVGDLELERNNGAFATFTLSKPITNFFGLTNNQITIDSNGVIWPGWYCGEICDAPARAPFPILSGYQIVACYWADVDLSANPNSHVYYRVANDFATKSTVNELVQQAYGKSNFDTTSNDLVIIIATWVNVTYEGGNHNTETNTFQCGIISDGTNSYSFHSYKNLQWANSPNEMAANNPAMAAIDTGYTDPTYNNYRLPLSQTSNVINLVTATNFVQPSPNGYYMLTMSVPYIPPNFNLGGIPSSTCTSASDPHDTSFDQLYIDSSFGAAETSGTVTQHQLTGNYIMVATSNCRPLYNYPPFLVSAIVQPCTPGDPSSSPITCPYGFKFILYLTGKSPQIELDVYYDHYFINNQQQARMTGTYSCPTQTCTTGNHNATFTIAPYGGGFQLTTSFALTVTFVPNTLQITVPQIDELQNNVFGYCGNLDGNPLNDNYCWNPALRTYNNYQNCWPESYLSNVPTSTLGVYQCQNYPPQSIDSPQEASAFSYPDWVTEKCQVLRDPNGVFSQCLSVSNFVYNGCLQDVFATNGDEATFCVDATELAQSCLALPGVTSLNWRSASLCPIQCQANAHYSSGFSPCTATCDNPLGPLFCPHPPTEGCVCDDGFVSQGNQCINLNQCQGCLTDTGIFVPSGAQWMTSNCDRTCTCNGMGNVVCVTNNCNQQASCAFDGTSSYCQCNQNYYGDGYFCGTTNNCSPANNCQNGAQCVTQENGYKCVCQLGYTGQNCDQYIDYCATYPCINGVCQSLVGHYECTCDQGYYGVNCDQKTNWCSSFPCTNLATCVSNDQSYQCFCPQGFSGQNCEIEEMTSTPSAPSTQTLPRSSSSTPAVHPTTSGPIGPTTSPPQGFNCNGEPDGDYSDPTNPCSHIYYVCSNGYTIQMNCPANLYYNSADDECQECSLVAACQSHC